MLNVSTIKIPIDTNFTSDLTHSLVNIGGVQLKIGGSETLPKTYKVTPMDWFTMVLTLPDRRHTAEARLGRSAGRQVGAEDGYGRFYDHAPAPFTNLYECM